MSYLVLARRWRPQRLEDVVGQDHVVRTLGNAIANDRIAHAYLFTGVRGVGKTSIARIFAKALNCAEGPSPTPCNKCSHCIEITNGSGVDVLEIDGASNTGVDDVRELREKVRYMPQSMKYKVYIIDEVHMLSIAAFNALLKTLEEPPPHVIFIFATTDAHKIPTTILSRCQRFDFRRIARNELLAGLERICKQEGFNIDPADLMLVAREAEGSMRDALSLMDQVVSFAGKDVPKGEVARALGIADRAWIAELAKAIIDGDAAPALKVVDRAFDHGYNLRELLKDLIGYTRHVAVARSSKKPDELIDLPAEEIEIIKEIAKDSSPEKIQAVFTILSKADENIMRAQDQKSIIEMAIIKASLAAPSLPVDTAIKRLEKIEEKLASGKYTAAAPSSSAPPGASGGKEPVAADAPPSVKKPEAVEDKQGRLFSWKSMLDAVREEGNPLLEVLLESAKFDSLENDTLTISISKNSAEFTQFQRKGTRSSIEKIASRLHGHEVKLKIVDKEDASGKRKLKSVETDLERALKEEARSHPLVQGAQSILEATIRDVRPKHKGHAPSENN